MAFSSHIVSPADRSFLCPSPVRAIPCSSPRLQCLYHQPERVQGKTQNYFRENWFLQGGNVNRRMYIDTQLCFRHIFSCPKSQEIWNPLNQVMHARFALCCVFVVRYLLVWAKSSMGTSPARFTRASEVTPKNTVKQTTGIHIMTCKRPLWGEPPKTDGFHSQSVSNA